MVTEKNNFGKMPPQAIEIEEAVLGALLIESDTLHNVSGIISAQSFYKTEHQTIFAAIAGLSADGKAIDLLTVTQELKNRNELEKIGGPLYITQLTSRVASAAHIEHHARIIAQQQIKREVIKACSEVSGIAYDGNTDIDEVLSGLRQKISEIENIGTSANSGKTQKAVVNESILEIESDCRKSDEGQVPGITTGIKILDRCIGGWRNTNLVIIAARPSIGKTSLALFFAKIAAKAGKWVNFYGLEMRSTDLFRIMLAGESEIARTSLRDGSLTDADWNKINNSVSMLEKLPIIWNDFAAITSSQIKSLTIRNRKAGKCDLVIIDYLQLVKPFDKKAIREQQISEISRTLKEISLSENIPVICLSQLNREAANEKPQLHHLRESGAIEQDADVVLFPWKNEAQFCLSVGKNRRGKVGDIPIYANDELTVFGDNHISRPRLSNFNSDRFIEPDKEPF